MADEKLLTIRDAAIILGVSEKETMDLAQHGSIPAYRIGGMYLRFKRPELEQYRAKHVPQHDPAAPKETYSFKDRVADFFYFNDFYIVSFLVTAAVLFIIVRG